MAPNSNETPKRHGLYIRFLEFYNLNFPTDTKSYNVRIPLLGVVLSLLSYQFVITFLWSNYASRNLVVFGYIILSLGAAYQLYYGLNLGDRKQYTPWLILKIVEICFTFAEFIDGTVKNHAHFDKVIGVIIFGFIVMCFNAGLFILILQKSLKRSKTNRGHKNDSVVDNIGSNGDENLYDIPREYINQA